jgi:hypothetical protein
VNTLHTPAHPKGIPTQWRRAGDPVLECVNRPTPKIKSGRPIHDQLLPSDKFIQSALDIFARQRFAATKLRRAGGGLPWIGQNIE